jgi:hypothetical protein
MITDKDIEIVFNANLAKFQVDIAEGFEIISKLQRLLWLREAYRQELNNVMNGR